MGALAVRSVVVTSWNGWLFSARDKCLDPEVCNWPNGRCVEPSRCSAYKAEPRGMKHYGFFCWLRRHKRGAADIKAYAVAGVVIDFCNTCSRDHLADIDYEALRAR